MYKYKTHNTFTFYNNNHYKMNKCNKFQVLRENLETSYFLLLLIIVLTLDKLILITLLGIQTDTFIHTHSSWWLTILSFCCCVQHVQYTYNMRRLNYILNSWNDDIKYLIILWSYYKNVLNISKLKRTSLYLQFTVQSISNTGDSFLNLNVMFFPLKRLFYFRLMVLSNNYVLNNLNGYVYKKSDSIKEWTELT